MNMHRKTAKAQGALDLMFEISGENPEWLRATHENVEAAYASLARDGYVWHKKRQIWEYIGPLNDLEIVRLYVSVAAKSQAEVLKIIESGAIIEDYTMGKVTRMEIVMHNGEFGVMFEIEVLK